MSGVLYARTMEIYCETLQEPEANPRCEKSDVVINKREIAVTSMRLRAEFLRESWELFKAHPWRGTGTGSFSMVYAEAAAQKHITATQNPHNAYCYILVEYGVLGFIAFLAFFAQQAWYQSSLPKKDRYLAQAILCSYFVGCFVNALIIDFTELHLWILLLALAYHAPRVKETSC